MKPLLLLAAIFMALHAPAQKADYISVRKKNGRVLKNFIAGSHILLQTREGRYWEGPLKQIHNDSLYLDIFDVRLYSTPWGSTVRDTIARFTLPLHHRDVARIYLPRRHGFWERRSGPLLMIAGAGYTTLNLANGITYGLPLTDRKNLRSLSVGAGLFAAGFLLQKLSRKDDFSTPKHRIVYVELEKPGTIIQEYRFVPFDDLN